MIARVTGTVVEQSERGVILESGGIGYAVFTPSMPVPGSTVTLHTQLIVREDAHELYGFETSAEKTFFGTLIGVSGVGPKTALHMLMLYPLGELVRIIRSGDAKAVSLVPGIGKKTAEKIIIDLKDKLSSFESTERGPESDLVEALLSLGYKEHQVRAVIPAIDATVPLQAQIRAALQMLGK